MNQFNGALAVILLSAAMPFANVVGVKAADDREPPKSTEPAAPSGKPFIINNPDGTFTIQKEPPDGTSENSKVQNGLVIPPQVVVPIASGIGKKR
jgi:hypothetical protein